MLQAGSFDLVVKVYATGKVSAYLGSLAVGDSIRVKGPKAAIKYRGYGGFVQPVGTSGA